jgi:response regulator of citrate/malate metabolism
MTRHDKLRILRACIQANRDVQRLWGDQALGLALICRFFDDIPWATAAELAEGTPLSEDTVRRRLETLASIGRVSAAKKGRLLVYQAHHEWADRTWNILNTFLLNANRV